MEIKPTEQDTNTDFSIMSGFHFRSIFLPLFLLLVFTSSAQINGHTCQHRHRGMTWRSASDASRSDTLDILHFDISLDFTQANAQLVSGVATMNVLTLESVAALLFDFEGMTTDSVHLNGESTPFTHSGETLNIVPASLISAGEELEVRVYYHGQPLQDDSGWGGFYFQSDYAYNLGVGFAADPHSYGRIWHPCFDNFVERAPYTLRVLTNNGKKSYCGGMLTSETVMNDSTLRVWELNQHIPSYLASVATGNYVHAEQTFNSMTGADIPIWLAAHAEDTTDLKNSFVNLIPALEAFEADFGPYRWPRVGYVTVPFSSGAMEHACNIAYPLFAANGSTANQTLMAHELSHHWWGDLVTCSTQEDMWLNEGMASHCEALFIEAIEGEDAYREYVRDNHRDVLLYAHIRDGERLPVSGIGHAYTYGDHVYNKGADVAHTLRSYMGDFYFPLMTAFLEDHAFTAVSTDQLREYLQAQVPFDLLSFFENWVFAPGFPEFREADVEIVPQGDDWLVTFNIEQYLHYAPQYYTNVPLEVSFVGTDETETSLVYVSGASTPVSITLGFEPKMIVLNRLDRISQAVLAEERSIESAGIKQFDFSDFRIDVDAFDAPHLLRIENHWAAADHELQPDLQVSQDRFWRIKGMGQIEGTGRIRMYGSSSSTNYFDPLLADAMLAINYPEDSLKVVYRAHNQAPWVALPVDLNTQGNANNYVCFLDFPMVGNGDYALAYGDVPSALNEWDSEPFAVFPNPADEVLHIPFESATYIVYSAAGKRVLEGHSTGTIDVRMLPAGAYVIEVNGAKTTFIKQ